MSHYLANQHSSNATLIFTPTLEHPNAAPHVQQAQPKQLLSHSASPPHLAVIPRLAHPLHAPQAPIPPHQAPQSVQVVQQAHTTVLLARALWQAVSSAPRAPMPQPLDLLLVKTATRAHTAQPLESLYALPAPPSRAQSVNKSKPRAHPPPTSTVVHAHPWPTASTSRVQPAAMPPTPIASARLGLSW